MTLSFAGIELTQYLNIEKTTKDILPPREVSLLDIPDRHGSYFTGVRYGVRKIQYNVSLVEDTVVGLMNTKRTLAACLDIDKPAELISSDEPNLVYFAILTEETSLDRIVTIGRGSLTFLCPDPFAYSLTPKVITPDSDGYFLFQNDGTTATFPKFTVNFTDYSNFVSFISPDGVLLVGNPAQVDSVTLPKTQTILHDKMETTDGWSSAPTSLDPGRVNAGAYAVKDVDGISATDYGAAAGTSTWHGPAMKKSLSEELSDFEVQVRMDFRSQDGTARLDGDQFGIIEIYMYDKNGFKIGKMSMRDVFRNYEYNIPEIFIQNTTFLEKQPAAPQGKKIQQKVYTTYTVKKGDTWGSIAKKYHMSATDLAQINNMRTTDTLAIGKKLKVLDKTVTKMVYPENVGDYNDFYGRFVFRRVNDTFYAEIARYNTDKQRYEKVIKDTLYDKIGQYSRNKLAYIVVYFGAYDNFPPVGYSRVTDIKVFKHNTDTSIEYPQIFQPNDQLEVNLSDSSVWLNGEPFMNEVDVASTFFPINEGETEVKVMTDDEGATFSAEYTERYL